MKRALSVAALKRHRVPHAPPAPRSVAEVAQRPDGFAITRRQALGLAGGLSLAAAPIASAVDAALSSSYRIVRRGPRIAFVVAGVERWVIDPRRFDGTPELTVNEGDDGIEITLKHAFYPGTTVPADLEAHIGRGTRPAISLRLPKMKVRAKAPFIPWLLGHSTLDDDIAIQRTYQVGDARLHAQGPAAYSFRPSWTLDVAGAMAVGLPDAGSQSFNGERLSIHLCSPDDGSLLVPAAKRHSIATVHRGHHGWEVPVRLANTESWSAYAADDAFDTLTVEASDDARTSVVFEGASDGKVWLQPHEIDVRIGLREVRYAWTVNDRGRHEALVARYASAPTWMVLAGISLEVGDREGIPPLEIERRNGELVRCIVAPALHRYTIPVNDAVTEPTRVHPKSQLALISPDVASSALPRQHVHLSSLKLDALQDLKVQRATINPQDAKKRITVKQSKGSIKKFKSGLTLAQNPSVTVIRPDDLLVLTFEFSGITINKSAGRFQAGSNGKLIVHFQPQHIAERAFFYTTEGPKTDSVEDKADAPDTDNEPLLEPPIDAVLAHPSRLVFDVPKSYAGTYSIDGLLDWSEFTQRVSPSAKPPDLPWALNKMSSAFIGKYLASGSTTVNPSRSMVVATKRNKAGGKSVASKSFAVSGNLKSKIPTKQRQGFTNKIQASGDFANSMSKSMVDKYLDSLAAANPPIRTPKDDETVIEYPYRLMLSPNKFAGWAHALTPKTDAENGRTELWHTRLGVKHSDGTINEEAEYFRTVRAIWSPDVGTAYGMPANDKERPFRTSINRRDRHELVQLTSNYGMQTKDEPVDVKRLMLTSLGAWADMNGGWDPMMQDQLDVEQWIQRGTQGRDHFVRICYKGYLFPFGHRATLVKETERKFRRTPRGDMAAYLMQRLYIILREPIKEYPADGLAGMQYQGRDTPFRRITITTKTTPNLRLPVALGYSMGSNSFWPQWDSDDGPADVQWTCIGRDWDNNDVQFSTPLTFIANGDAGQDYLANWINNGYRKNNSVKTRRTIDMAGQSIAFAPSVKKGDTTLPTAQFMQTGYYSDSVPANTPRFFPSMQKATVSIEKVNELLGTDSPREIEYFLPYLRHAFEKGAALAKGAKPTKDTLDDLKNTSQIFVSLLESMEMNFNSQSDKSGGLAAPSIGIGALSRVMGPIPGDLKIPENIENEIDRIEALADKVENAVVAAGNFDPMQYFEDLLTSKILGDITLQDVLDFLQDILDNADQMPALDKKDDYGVSDAIKEAASTSEILADLEEKVNKNEAVRTAAKKLDAELNQIDAEVKAAKQRLEAEIDQVVDEINALKQEIQNEVMAAKRELENKVREWKRRVDDKVNELKSEIDKAIQPLKEAGNEAYKRYTEVTDALETLKKGLNLSLRVVHRDQEDTGRPPGADESGCHSKARQGDPLSQGGDQEEAEPRPAGDPSLRFDQQLRGEPDRYGRSPVPDHQVQQDLHVSEGGREADHRPGH